MQINLSDEKVEDLQRDNLKIIQNHNYYCFSEDSVLLSTFAKVKINDLVVEFCSGSGVISILLNAKYHPKQIVGFEIDSYLCSLSNKSLKLNNISNIEFINRPLEDAKDVVQNVDCVVCNPPYYLAPQDISKISPKNLRAKYEISTSLQQILENVSKILKNKGKFFLVYPISRLQELMIESKNNNLFCKNIEIINKSGKCEIALFEFVKNGKFSLQLKII